MTQEADRAIKKKILIIDDQYSIRELLETLLQDEYDVTKAESAAEARLILKEPVDLILLDVMMPDFDGYTFCKEIKQSIATKHIPVMMLTAKHRIQDLQPAIDAGVDEYLTKPFEDDYLQKRIHIMTNRIKEDDIPEQGFMGKNSALGHTGGAAGK